MGGGARPTVKLLFSSSDDGTVKVWDLIVSSFQFLTVTLAVSRNGYKY